MNELFIMCLRLGLVLGLGVLFFSACADIPDLKQMDPALIQNGGDTPTSGIDSPANPDSNPENNPNPLAPDNKGVPPKVVTEKDAAQCDQNHKALICHKYASGHERSLCVDVHAVEAHLAHGDMKGLCKPVQ